MPVIAVPSFELGTLVAGQSIVLKAWSKGRFTCLAFLRSTVGDVNGPVVLAQSTIWVQPPVVALRTVNERNALISSMKFISAGQVCLFVFGRA